MDDKCTECNGTAKGGYKRCPKTGREQKDKKWCRECYERICARCMAEETDQRNWKKQ